MARSTTELPLQKIDNFLSILNSYRKEKTLIVAQGLLLVIYGRSRREDK